MTNTIPESVQSLIDKLQRANREATIMVIQDIFHESDYHYYDVKIAHDAVTDIQPAFEEYEGLKIFSATAYSDSIRILMKCLPTTIEVRVNTHQIAGVVAAAAEFVDVHGGLMAVASTDVTPTSTITPSSEWPTGAPAGHSLEGVTAIDFGPVTELDFRPAVARLELDLRRVWSYLPKCEVVGLREVALPGVGWATRLHGRPWESFGSVEDQVRAAIDAGGTSFQFIIKEFDRSLRVQYRYPDFGLREITRANEPDA